MTFCEEIINFQLFISMPAMNTLKLIFEVFSIAIYRTRVDRKKPLREKFEYTEISIMSSDKSR
jgi:hypothetical protein